MATSWNGNYVPAEGDNWNLVADMRKMANQNNRLIPCWSKEERDALGAVAPNGVIPEGTVVLRMDQAAAGPVYDVFVDGAWVDGDTGWVELTPYLMNGWVGSSGTVFPYVRRLHGEVLYMGQLANATATGNSQAFTAPPGFRPKSGGTLYFPLGQSTSIEMNARIGTDGICTIWQEGTSGALRPLNAIKYRVD